MSFTASAARLAGQLGLILGWRPAEFWAATPAELAGIFDAAQSDSASLAPQPEVIARLQTQFPDSEDRD